MHGQISKFVLETSLIPLLILISHSSFASESNLINFSYPDHTCDSKPTKPLHPPKLSTIKDVDTYNHTIAEYNVQVAEYNKLIKNYKSCINQYIKNGNQDITIIRKKLNSALKEARSK